MYRDFQSRLAMKLEPMVRRLNDNSIELAGAPTDCIRLKSKTNAEGDTISRIITRADVVSVMFPPLVDVPYRIVRKNGEPFYCVTSLVGAAEEEDGKKNYLISCPHNSLTEVNDRFYRVFLDPDSKLPMIQGIEVTDTLGTFGQQMLLWSKFKCALITEELDEKHEQTIISMAERHLKLRF